MAKFSKIIRQNNENLLINNFIKIFKHYLYKKIRKSKRFSFVLTGGASPVKLYRKIAKLKNIPWAKIDFFIGDERYIKETSKYSNFNMCKKHLFNVLKIPNYQIFKVPTNGNNIRKNNEGHFYLTGIKALVFLEL